MSNIVTLAHENVKNFYDLSGTPEEIQLSVEWLLSEANFIFSDVNVKVWMCCRKILVLMPPLLEANI